MHSHIRNAYKVSVRKSEEQTACDTEAQMEGIKFHLEEIMYGGVSSFIWFKIL
jgi:hypothetical protein